ncbi:hypothetical protein [Photobacterium leiognathi]|uniref:hypothetical protein n=1 Tax=Photobacterium leiognathi TaxID=553611 RepID=UPI002981693D|nr:hypothetical protein [Photobacterium leiognathi]
MKEIIKVLPVVLQDVKDGTQKIKKPCKMGREPSANNIYLVTASETPENAEFALMLNEHNIQSAYFTLKNSNLKDLGDGEHKGSISLKKHRMFIINEQDPLKPWQEVFLKLPTDPHDFIDYDSVYRKKVMMLWKREANGYFESAMRAVVTQEYSLQSSALNMLFFAPKTEYNKFQKSISHYGLRFIEWLTKSLIEHPFTVSTVGCPNDKIVDAFNKVGDGEKDADGYYYFKRNAGTPKEYIIRRNIKPIKVIKEFNQFNINNGVYRIKNGDEYEYFAPNLLIKSEAIGKALGLDGTNKFLKNPFEANEKRHHPTYQDLIAEVQPLFKKELEKKELVIERLNSKLEWVSIFSDGVYGQKSQNMLIENVNKILVPSVDKWHECKFPLKPIIDNHQYLKELIKRNLAKSRLNETTRLVWGVDFERLLNDCYQSYYSMTRPCHVGWVEFCNKHKVNVKPE